MEREIRHVTARFPDDGKGFPAIVWRGMPVFDSGTAADIADHFAAHPGYFPEEFTQFHPHERVFEQFDTNGAVIERYTPIRDLEDLGEYYSIGSVSDWEWEVEDGLGDRCGYGPEER